MLEEGEEELDDNSEEEFDDETEDMEEGMEIYNKSI